MDKEIRVMFCTPVYLIKIGPCLGTDYFIFLPLRITGKKLLTIKRMETGNNNEDIAV